MQHTDDSTLLRRFAEDHADDAYAELVERHINLVYSVAVRQVGSPADAEEITQAVFIILAKKAGELRHEKALSSWLFQTTRLTANNFIRSEMRRHRREQEACMQSALNESGDVVWQRIAPVLDDAVTALGEKDRRAIILRFYEGRNLREVGVVLGASEDAAEKRVARALEKLRKFFSKRGVDSTTTALAGAISAYSVQAAPVGLAKTISAVAVAKSAVASTSILTLARGAMKVMAWSKTKTTIVSVAVVLLGIGATTIVVNAMLPAPDIQGAWEGTLNMPGAGVHKWESPSERIVMKIARVNGVFQANVSNLGTGDRGPFDTFTYKYPYVHAENREYKISCTGKVSRFGEILSWNALEGTNAYAMVFKRTTHPTPFPEQLTDAEFAPRTDSALQGFWVGKIGWGTDAVRIEIKIAEVSNGTYRADFYAPAQATNRFPTTVSYDGATVKVTLTAGYGMFEGWLRNGDKEIVGNWIQDDNRTRTTLMKTNYSEYAVEGAK